jgi:excisionase family DNA binding protein
MPEIIDQANELEEPSGSRHAKCRINHAAVSATHCRDCGEEIPERRGNWWRAASAALTVKKKRNYAVSIGGDMASDKPITAQQAADLLIVSARVIYRLIDSGELAGRKVGNKYRTTEAACIAYLKTPRDPVIANAGEHKGEVLCQSPSGAACGTVISLRRQEKELGDLLARGTKSRLRSSTTS